MDLSAFRLLQKIKKLHKHNIFHGDIKPGNIFGADGFLSIFRFTTDCDSLVFMDGNSDHYYIKRYTPAFAS